MSNRAVISKKYTKRELRILKIMYVAKEIKK